MFGARCSAFVCCSDSCNPVSHASHSLETMSVLVCCYFSALSTDFYAFTSPFFLKVITMPTRCATITTCQLKLEGGKLKVCYASPESPTSWLQSPSSAFKACKTPVEAEKQMLEWSRPFAWQAASDNADKLVRLLLLDDVMHGACVDVALVITLDLHHVQR